MAELVRLAWAMAPAAFAALLDLLRSAHRGDGPEEISRQAEKLAHIISFEAALKVARRGRR